MCKLHIICAQFVHFYFHFLTPSNISALKSIFQKCINIYVVQCAQRVNGKAQDMPKIA